MKKFLSAIGLVILVSSAWAGGPKRALVQVGKGSLAKPSAAVSIDVLMKEALLLGRKNAVSVVPTSQGIRTPIKLASVSQSALLDKSVRLQARLLLNSPLSSAEQQLFLNLYPFLPKKSHAGFSSVQKSYSLVRKLMKKPEDFLKFPRDFHLRI